ncbi:MAG: ferritin family protein [Desulfobacterales bacterium]|nr:ferritin family protein [Desulfobacterales bacterium]
MSYDFNADDIFEIAEQLERNGAAFYRDAAGSVDDSSVKEFLLEFAAMEDEHEKTFIDLRKELTSAEKTPTVFDPNNESALYLKALADTRIFFKKDIDTSTVEGIFKSAITAEKDSIVFYLGMKDLVPGALGKDRMDAIIREEMGHIKILSQKLAALK